MSFTLPQAIAVAEAVERGLARGEKVKKDISRMGPVCTLMVGWGGRDEKGLPHLQGTGISATTW